MLVHGEQKLTHNLNLIEQLTGGFATVSIAGGAGTTALDVDDGALTGTAQSRVIEFTGSISGNRIVTIPNDIETFYILKNSTTGAYTVQFKYATGSGASTTFSTTDKGTKIVYASASPDATNPIIVDVMANSSEIALTNSNPIKFQDADNSAFVGIDAPATVSGSYTLTLTSSSRFYFSSFSNHRWFRNSRIYININFWNNNRKSYCNGNDFRIKNKHRK